MKEYERAINSLTCDIKALNQSVCEGVPHYEQKKKDYQLALAALYAAQEREKPLTLEDEIIATPEACPFCEYFDYDRELCMNRESPCCGQWIEDITFGCTLFEPSEQAEGGSL